MSREYKELEYEIKTLDSLIESPHLNEESKELVRERRTKLAIRAAALYTLENANWKPFPATV